jgi:NAD(P)-dependent dehydrogenase (short-subunit alcohol dehydrogenase family)
MSTATKRALVVGGTSGIGHGCALALAKRGVDVTIAGRSTKAGTQILDQLQTIAPNGKHAFVKIDCFSLKDVKKVADQINGSDDGLDYLVMSQGMATIQGFTPTTDGLDQKMSLHYYSRMLLGASLALKLGASSDPRVMSVLSGGVHSPYKGFKNDVDLKKHYSIPNAANAAGFYNDLGLDTLADQHPSISYTHSAPGFVATKWGTEMPWYIRGPTRMFQFAVGKSKEDCGEDLVKGMLENSKKGFNVMDQNGRVAGSKTSMHSADSKSFIWGHTMKVFEDLGVM